MRQPGRGSSGRDDCQFLEDRLVKQTQLITDPSLFTNNTQIPGGIIDSQIHLFRTIGLDAGLAAMNALGIQGAVIDEFWTVEQGGRELFSGYGLANGATRAMPSQAMHASSRYPNRFRYLARTDHRDPDVHHWIKFIADSPHACATRLIVRSEVEVRDFREGRYRPCFQAAADHGVPIFLFLDEGDTAPAIRYIEEFPSATIILDHMGMGRSREEVRTPDKLEATLKLAVYKNVFIKWCHAYFGFGTMTYPFEGTREPLRRTVDAFGAERLMWASDFTIREHEVSWMDRLLSVRESPVLSNEEKGWILGGTARAVLGWPS